MSIDVFFLMNFLQKIIHREFSVILVNFYEDNEYCVVKFINNEVSYPLKSIEIELLVAHSRITQEISVEQRVVDRCLTRNCFLYFSNFFFIDHFLLCFYSHTHTWSLFVCTENWEWWENTIREERDSIPKNNVYACDQFSIQY